MTVPVYFWYPVASSLGIGFMFMNIAPVADQFMELFGVGYAGLSFFISAIYWTHSMVQVPAGLLIDRIGAVRSLIICLAICFVCSVTPFLAPESLSLAGFSRLFLGLGSGALFLVAVKIAKILTPPNFITRVQGAQGAAFCLGTMAPYLTLPYLGDYGWVGAYLLGAGTCLILAAGIYWLPIPALRQEKSSSTLVQVWDAVKIISTSKMIWLIGICHGLSYGTLNTIGNWLPSILADTRPGTVTGDWAIAASVMLLAGTAGRVIGSEAPRLMPRGVFIGRVTVLIAALYIALAISHNPVPLIASAVVMAFFCGGTYASVFTLTIDISAPAYVATAVGFMNMVANIVNVLLTLLLGNTREFTGSFSVGLLMAGIGSIVVWAVAHRLLAAIEKR